MSAAHNLLDRLTEIGATVMPANGGRLILRAGPRPVPGELVRQLRETKTEIIALIALRGARDDDPQRSTGGAWWRDRFTARIAHWSLDGQRPWQEAERLAFGEMILDWNRLHGARPEPGRCAGCGDEMANDVGFGVDSNGTCVHFGGVRRDDCIIAYGQKWRSAAIAGLRALGVDPPKGFELL
jgi:hypothetical protein